MKKIRLVNPTAESKRKKPFYVIVHRIDVGIVIDLKPMRRELDWQSM